jgi:hypothetical protein
MFLSSYNINMFDSSILLDMRYNTINANSSLFLIGTIRGSSFMSFQYQNSLFILNIYHRSATDSNII